MADNETPVPEVSRIYCVLKDETSLASAVKLVYLAAFVITCSTLFSFTFGLKDFTDARRYEDAELYVHILNGALIITSVIAILHHIRIYLTVELVEDPTSRLHRATVAGLHPFWQAVEQAIRLIIIAFVGLKALDFISAHTSLSQIVLKPATTILDDLVGPLFGIKAEEYHFDATRHQLKLFQIVYLANIFLLLLFWDFIIFIGTNKAAAQSDGGAPKSDTGPDGRRRGWLNFVRRCFARLSMRSRLVLSHVAGLFVCMAFIVTLHKIGQTLGTRHQEAVKILPLASLLLLSYLFTVLYAVIVLFDIRREFDSYRHVGRSMLRNILKPYYGHSCPGICFNSQQTEQEESPSGETS
jgi:hypothetical protein